MPGVRTDGAPASAGVRGRPLGAAAGTFHLRPRTHKGQSDEGITSIDHVALRVKEFECSLAFYIGTLGFSAMFGLDRDGSLWIIYLRVTDDPYLTATGPSSLSINSNRYNVWLAPVAKAW